MAKWDERDPRWLVEHRNDGKNVNGWHWEERNMTAWSKETLQRLLLGLPGSEQSEIVITTLSDVSGEVTLTTRKGNKKVALFDIEIKLAWETRGEAGEQAKGEISISEFASTSDPEDIEFSFTAAGSGPAQDKGRSLAASLQPLILERLQQFLGELQQQ